MAKGENTKKAAGNAKKAEVAAQKQAVENQKKAKVEEQEWSKGAKDSSKAAAAADKKAEAERKKAEKAALLAEEDAALPSKKTGNAKTAQKKSRGLDLSGLDGPSSLSSLSATGIDNALDALSLTTGSSDKIDRHPERRFKAAYTQYEERRLEEMKEEKGLRRQQKIEQIRKEFEKHPDNPFNQANATYNSTREDLQNIREGELNKIEKRLGGP
ncbi:hypothetical protein AUEXF2481DRAFT_80980 [Aureobasidium subglaciale EXF-2481]|uniref:DUF1014-domain-containing protein n=1 Tax=Aureobasidium subglaciale (strain EXF-2481) TaxID=1043005 RepID=A0A074Z5J6_AURSE|nr:uncharacterized protein AUEXF2481DRAFT_80980 [Aureobasidium subglaciale EXF-2481]KAI5208377.1 DUF1014-domain-containing protein [Aureobasidium subglaciale]KAI5227300.1 DUF1014-domain-containing protein [Aureobasidium subglaciale]KAI5230610.1 DUF1014-domain-containing protein [Aureobasidium subglaciale]KAI5264861.1 DUF1014-domain-containing protein [Aureobasidium subglaciale]KEQ94206.1 hypothetical protein AUEXF2481DRAFT_80980 [Aureobasidium subglaciale EXF-2481]